MTSEERRHMREWLIAQGFKRVSYTQDDSYGIYDESWMRGADEVVLRWGPRG